MPLKTASRGRKLTCAMGNRKQVFKGFDGPASQHRPLCAYSLTLLMHAMEPPGTWSIPLSYLLVSDEEMQRHGYSMGNVSMIHHSWKLLYSQRCDESLWLETPCWRSLMRGRASSLSSGQAIVPAPPLSDVMLCTLSLGVRQLSLAQVNCVQLYDPYDSQPPTVPCKTLPF